MNKDKDKDFSIVLINLLKSVISRDDNPDLWQKLLIHQSELSDYLDRMGLKPAIFEDEGYAFLQNRDNGEEDNLPRLISRRQLTYPVSLILALLRRKMAEHDAASGEIRIILEKEEIIEMAQVYFPAGSNEVQFVKKIESALNKIQEMGFIRFPGKDKKKLEIKRIIKAFIDAQWLNEFELNLRNYREFGSKNDQQ